MSELQIIEAVLQRTVRRRRLESAWRGFWKGLLAGGALWFLVLTAYKLFPLPAWSLPAAGIAGGVLALAGLAAGAARRISILETARWLDQRRHLQERLSTAVEVSQSVDATWRTLVIGDAARHAQDLNVRELLPFRFQTAGRWALLLLLASAGLGFVPEYRSQRSRQKQQDAAQIRETGRKLVELTRRSVEQRKPLLEPTQKAVDAVAELGEKLQAQSLTRTEALRELASVTDKLNQQARELEKNPALQRLERAARESGGGATAPGELQKQMQSLQKSLGQAAGHPEKLDRLQKDLEKLRQNAASLPDKSTPEGAAAREQMSQALADLARQAQELGANAAGIEEAIQAMQADRTDLVAQDLNTALNDLEKMQAMAEAMKQLQQQMANVGKDLAEQLDKGQVQAAVSTLRKMMDQLKASPLSKDQLRKIIDEVSRATDPAADYGQVAEYLKKAAQQMQQGEKPDAADNLAKAAQELENLMQQMADSQSLDGALDALRRAQMAVATRQSWESANCKNCNGAGCALCKGKGGKGRGWRQGGKPGTGVGTWAEEQGWTYFPEESERVDNSAVKRPDLDPRGLSDRGEGQANPNLLPTKVRGQLSPGGSMPSITLKGVSIKGQSSVGYQEAAVAAQAEAQSALNHDQVPRAYQGTVREYFDDLKK